MLEPTVIADGQRLQKHRTLIGVLSSWEQSSDVESGSSSEELMKHRPQGSLGDSSCQDWREETGTHKHQPTHTHTHVSQQGHTQRLSTTQTVIFSPATGGGSCIFNLTRKTREGSQRLNHKHKSFSQNRKKFITCDKWMHRLGSAEQSSISISNRTKDEDKFYFTHARLQWGRAMWPQGKK